MTTNLECPSVAESTSSVAKALSLLDVFVGARHAVGVSEASRRAGLPKSTAFRLLAALEEAQLIERNGRKFQLSYRLFELSTNAVSSRPDALREICMPYLVDLHTATKLVVHLGVLDGSDVLYLEKLYGTASPRTPSSVGARLPATCCGLGKAMLAFSAPDVIRAALSRLVEERRTPYTITVPSLFVDELRSIRRSGIAYDREESAVGLSCVALPLLAADGTPVGAISISGRSVGAGPTAHLGAIKRAAAEVTRAIRSNDELARAQGA